MSPDAAKAVGQVFDSGYIGQGSRVEVFEDLLREQLQSPHVVTVNSCTSALQLALHLVAGDMDEGAILLPPLSCFATVSAALTTNLRLSWVDLDPETLLIDLNDLESKLNAETKVVMVVHFAGAPVNMIQLHYILERHEQKYGFYPYVIEDCAQSFGSNVGFAYPSIRCFSFQAVKMLTTVDGGALAIPDEFLAERAKRLRWYGLDRREELEGQNIVESGWKYHMNDVNAQIGISNLTYIQNNDLLDQQKRRFYQTQIELSDYCGFPIDYPSPLLPPPCSNQFPLMLKNKESFIKEMAELGIESSPSHYRCDKHACVAEYKNDNLPGMDLVEKEMTLIPIGWWLSDEQWRYVIDCVKDKVEFSWREEGF